MTWSYIPNIDRGPYSHVMSFHVISDLISGHCLGSTLKCRLWVEDMICWTYNTIIWYYMYAYLLLWATTIFARSVFQISIANPYRYSDYIPPRNILGGASKRGVEPCGVWWATRKTYTASQNWFVHICALWELPKIANKDEQRCDVEGVFPLSWAAQRCNLVRRWPWCAHWRRSFWLWGLGFRLKELACQNQCRWFDDQQTAQEWSGAWSFSRTHPRWLWCSQAG